MQRLEELREVTQDFIDAIFRHNGRQVPRPTIEQDRSDLEVSGTDLPKLKVLLESIDADCGYEDWLHILMAIFHETGGSEEGLALADAWSAPGTKYPGISDIEAKWRSFKLDVANPVTIATLILRARESGADTDAILDQNEAFVPCDYEVIVPNPSEPPARSALATPLDKFSLLGSSEEIKREMVEAVPVLGHIALKGQCTFIYAAPGVGKTLLVLNLLIEAIRAGTVDPARTYYANLDDNLAGLHAKLQLAEEFGFHMLTEGRKGFAAPNLQPILEDMAKTGSAKNTIVIVDTLKKFTDLMEKRQTSQFMATVRRFELKGGTFIGLAHVNKKPGADGRAVFAGTTDVRDDADCTYMLEEIPTEAGKEKFVEFRNTKRRGNNPLSLGFAYTLDRDITYADLLLSVREIDPEQLVPLRAAAERASEASVVTAIEACIREGIQTKMKLATAAGKAVGISRRDAGIVIDKYTGDDPAAHHWQYQVGARGAHVYTLLDRPPADPAAGNGG